MNGRAMRSQRDSGSLILCLSLRHLQSPRGAPGTPIGCVLPIANPGRLSARFWRDTPLIATAACFFANHRGLSGDWKSATASYDLSVDLYKQRVIAFRQGDSIVPSPKPSSDFDFLRYIGAVTRELQNRDHQGRPARVLVASCAYDTVIGDVWDAITNPERIPRWFLPVSGDLRLGGRYQLEGNAGGQITACEPPRSLDLTWEFGGQVSWVNVRLSELSDGGTNLRLEHIAQVPEEFWNQYGPGAVGVGWDLTMLGLGLHLETNTTLDPRQAALWPTTEVGKDFV